ncbi:MAG TPA: histidine kinase [Chloroflexota bacterium]|jgi:two-component system sensor histidine kinase KdpD
MQRQNGALDSESVSGQAGQPGRSAWHRVYLGYAPGVGKTFEMLRHAHQYRARGADVVVGWVETYGRRHTIEALGELDTVSPRVLMRKGVVISEMDVDAILARRPQLVLVDELAHANVIGSRNHSRYQDALELVAADISVMSTLNIQQLASLQDTLRVLTGTTVSETLPDWVLESADELEMVDAAPETVRKRVRRGNVLPTQQVQRALEGYFQTDTLMALRELTSQRVAAHAARDAAHAEVREPRTAETVLVWLPATDQAQAILMRGVHLANRLHARLVVLHITSASAGIAANRGYPNAVKALQLAQALGAEVQTRSSRDVAEALVAYATEAGATQLVVGDDAPRRWWEVSRRSTLSAVLHRTRDMDVHVVRRAER